MLIKHPTALLLILAIATTLSWITEDWRLTTSYPLLAAVGIAIISVAATAAWTRFSRPERSHD